ncbi:MAG: DUF4301 family protein, partial [Acidobacteriota bacterium]|nr:DUF4301 family protein [Acidobacteriota bacterium]
MPEFPTDGDIAEIDRRRISRAEIERQLATLRNPPAAIELLRPCRVGSGIKVLPPADWEGLEREWDAAAQSGRLMKFVPASGAASRMFSFLQTLLETGKGEDSP